MERMNQIRIGMIGVGAGWIAIIGKFGQSQINFLKYDLINSLKQSQKKWYKMVPLACPISCSSLIYSSFIIN